MTILDKIVAAKKIALEKAKKDVPLTALKAQVSDRVVYADFANAITRASDEPINVIAEIKKASPSKGVIRQDFNAIDIAAAYTKAGVDAISILTEEDFFQGDLEYISQVHTSGITQPILRKDFLFDPYQMYESAANGADAVLLIVAMLDKASLQELCTLAVELKLFPIIEVFTAEELETALTCAHCAIQINNRDLKSFTVDIQNTVTLMQHIPADNKRPVISASGFFSRDEVAVVEEAGVDAILVGESLMRMPDAAAISRHVKELRGG